MFKTILVPVDLAHRDTLARALQAAADLAKLHGATVIYTGVTAAAPSPIAHNPEEYARKLAGFAEAEAAAHGITTESHPVVTHDPAVDLDPTLLKVIDETGADLVVMASHPTTLADYVWSSNGGEIASHAKVSVMLVR